MSGSPFGILEAQSSKKASEAQLKAAEQAAAVQLQMYNQSRADLAPWRKAGAGAINALWGTGGTPAKTVPGAPIYGPTPKAAQAASDTGESRWEWQQHYNWETGQMEPRYVLASASSPGAKEWVPSTPQAPIIGYKPSTTTPGTPGTQGLIQRGPGEFKESEGYQWTLGQGLQAQQRQAAATGRMGSGAYLKDATRYAEGLASTEYDNFLRRYYQSLDPYFRMAGFGSNVAMSGQGAATQTGNALANTYMQGGAAQAAGILGQGNAYSNAMTGAGNQLGNYLMQRPWGAAGGAGGTGGWNAMAGSDYAVGPAWGAAAGGAAALDPSWAMMVL